MLKSFICTFCIEKKENYFVDQFHFNPLLTNLKAVKVTVHGKRHDHLTLTAKCTLDFGSFYYYISKELLLSYNAWDRIHDIWLENYIFSCISHREVSYICMLKSGHQVPLHLNNNLKIVVVISLMDSNIAIISNVV